MTTTRMKSLQTRSSEAGAITVTESDAYLTLLARARRRTGGVPAERIVAQLLHTAATPPAPGEGPARRT